MDIVTGVQSTMAKMIFLSNCLRPKVLTSSMYGIRKYTDHKAMI